MHAKERVGAAGRGGLGGGREGMQSDSVEGSRRACAHRRREAGAREQKYMRAYMQRGRRGGGERRKACTHAHNEEGSRRACTHTRRGGAGGGGGRGKHARMQSAKRENKRARAHTSKGGMSQENERACLHREGMGGGARKYTQWGGARDHARIHADMGRAEESALMHAEGGGGEEEGDGGKAREHARITQRGEARGV